MNSARTYILATVSFAVSMSACDEQIAVAPLEQGRGKVHVLDTGGPQGDTGWWPSIAVDAQDRPHLSYCDAWRGDLKYATRQDGRWRTEAIIEEGAVGKYTALAVAPDGGLGVAFYDQDTKYLRYARRPAGATLRGPEAWTAERIAWGLEVGMAAELVFDSQGQAHLFYYVPSGKLIHAVRKLQPTPEADSRWTKKVIDEVTGSWTVRIHPLLDDDGLWLSYVHWNFKNTTLFVAHTRGAGPLGELTIEAIGDRRGPGWRSQLLGNADDPPGVLYTEAASSTLRLARRSDDGWKTAQLLKDVGNFVAASHGDRVVVAYEDVTGASAGRGLVRLLRRDGSSWRRFVFDPEGPSGEHMDMALDSKGRAIVAYYGRDIRGLKIFEEAATP